MSGQTIKVTTVSTRGEKQVIEMSASAEWSTLKKILQDKGFKTDGVKFVESTQKHTLEAPNALLPATDFFLFIMPLRNKSGATVQMISARDRVKALFLDDKEHAKAHFGNYTQKKEADLAILLKTYKKRSAAEIKAATKVAPVKKISKPKKVAIAKVVASVTAVAPATINPDEEYLKIARSLPDVRL